MEGMMYIGIAVVVLVLLVFFRTEEGDSYPPKDDKGRPMKAGFGARGTSFRFVRSSHN